MDRGGHSGQGAKSWCSFPYGLPVKETVGQERLWFASYELEHQNTPVYTDDLYSLYARWYFPSMARFLSPDPVRGDPAQPQSLNLYAYVRGNPINFVDPWGLKDQGAMSPASTSDEWQRDGVCSGVLSDPDCAFHEEITVTGKAPGIDLQAIADAHDAKVLQEWLAWQAYTNSAYALGAAAHRPPEIRAPIRRELPPPPPRHHDYSSLTLCGGAILSFCTGLTWDVFGQLYLTAAVSVGKSLTPLSLTAATGGWDDRPNAAELEQRLTSWGASFGFGALLGLNLTAPGFLMSRGTAERTFVLGVGLGVSGGYSWRIRP
jgi:RHS repeat-associated protein